MLDMVKIEKVRRSGAVWGQRWVIVKSVILWRFSTLRRFIYKRRYRVRNKLIKAFMESFKSMSRVRLVACDDCQSYRSQVGIDFDSEKYGWEYLGGHFWNCPKCKERKNAN